MTKPAFTEADDHFHFDLLGDDWWATETSWFSFHDADRKLGGWFYSMFRPNIGTVAGGAWIWDDSAHLPWEVPYCANYSALELLPDTNLTNCELPTGVSIQALEPGQRYAIGFNDGERLQADLDFVGIMPPEPLTGTNSTFGKASHFDQLGRVSGKLCLHGEEIEINCLSMRDRSWGRRPENRPRQAAYVTAAAENEDGFLAVTGTTPEADPISFGFLRQAGETLKLIEGERIVIRDPVEGWVQEVRINARAENGASIDAVGVPESRIIINRHTFIDINSLIRWNFNGIEAWGEDQDMWPVHRWSRKRRNQQVR
ncbi:MAG: DUF7065 domain-containing protein [Gammaproteobacteria bacterium]